MERPVKIELSMSFVLQHSMYRNPKLRKFDAFIKAG
jgi:hypothetical protein